MNTTLQLLAGAKICRALDMSKGLVDCIVRMADQSLVDQIMEVDTPEEIQELAIKMVPDDMLPSRLRPPEPNTLSSSEELSN